MENANHGRIGDGVHRQYRRGDRVSTGESGIGRVARPQCDGLRRMLRPLCDVDESISFDPERSRLDVDCRWRTVGGRWPWTPLDLRTQFRLRFSDRIPTSPARIQTPLGSPVPGTRTRLVHRCQDRGEDGTVPGIREPVSVTRLQPVQLVLDQNPCPFISSASSMASSGTAVSRSSSMSSIVISNSYSNVSPICSISATISVLMR